MNFIIIVLLLLMLLYVTKHMPWRMTVKRDHRIHGDLRPHFAEQFGSDYSNSFYGAQIWNGWSY